jgi:ribosomal protein S13
VLGKLDKIKNRKEDTRSIYGFESTVTTSIFTEADIKGFKVFVSLAKKAKQKLQDEVLELNVRTDIRLNVDTVQTLNSEALL